eukprot:scaffold22589_cov138-Cylindrotheca_fusiformis.AAC.35
MAESEIGSGTMAASSATTNSPNQHSGPNSFSSTSALVAFLRMEADAAEQKAKRFRDQAAALARQYGISEADLGAYDCSPQQMAPLDEHGVPKYKGKKRGRKPKARKRKANPNRRKRQHTAYTLFVKETYPRIKAAYPEYPSKDVISIVAKQWKHDISGQEKEQWKARAVATHGDDEDGDQPQSVIAAHEEEAAAAAAAAAAAVEEEEDDDDEESIHEDVVEGVDEDEAADEDGDETEEEPVPPARRSKRTKKK